MGVPAGPDQSGVPGQARGLAVARVCAARGWPVLPVRLWRDRPGHLEKRPRLTGWHEAATTDERVLAGWWARWPGAAPGVPTGTRTGLYVVDEDEPGAADRHWPGLAAGWDWHPSRTEGHRHAYFHGGGPRRSTGQNVHAGVDVKGERSYVVAWEPLPPPWALVPLPPEVRHLVGRGRDEWKPAAGGVSLDMARVAVSNAPEGQRNATLNRWAWGTYTRVRAGLVTEVEWREVLVAAAAASGYPVDDAHGVLDSIVRARAGRP